MGGIRSKQLADQASCIPWGEILWLGEEREWFEEQPWTEKAGSLPSHFKSTLVSALLKKPSLNKDSMTHYRPVFNLIFVSKLLEKVGVNQLNFYINSSNLYTHYRFAYRNFHSTETALLKIHSTILASMAKLRYWLCLNFTLPSIS